MKIKLLLLCILLSASTLAFSQGFASVGSQWYYNESGNGTAPGNSEYIHFKSMKDTVIKGITTHKIFRTYYKYNGSEIILKPFYVYEKSDTAFLYNFEMSKFKTIYIFNAKKGDTLTIDIPEQTKKMVDSTYRLIIDTVEITKVDGVNLKKYKTRGLDRYNFYNAGGSFMDRVGGLDAFFPRRGIFPEAGGPVRCFSDTQIDTSFQKIACNYRIVNSLDDSKTEDRLTVFPNPVTDLLTVQTAKPIEKMELRNMTGNLVFTSSELFMDIKTVETGMYTLTLFFRSGQSKRISIVKISQ